MGEMMMMMLMMMLMGGSIQNCDGHWAEPPGGGSEGRRILFGLLEKLAAFGGKASLQDCRPARMNGQRKRRLSHSSTHSTCGLEEEPGCEPAGRSMGSGAGSRHRGKRQSCRAQGTNFEDSDERTATLVPTSPSSLASSITSYGSNQAYRQGIGGCLGCGRALASALLP